jgi:ATP-dependent protease ClpP protease subunit
LELEEHDRQVSTTVTGKAFSAACILSLAGDVRRIDRRAFVMAHFPTPHSREAAIEMVDIVREYTGQPESEIGSWLAREKLFDAAEALRFGFADRIVDSDAPEPVWLKEPVKRRPTEWLKAYRELYERYDLRLPAVCLAKR